MLSFLLRNYAYTIAADAAYKSPISLKGKNNGVQGHEIALHLESDQKQVN